jgi:hypothetical protein
MSRLPAIENQERKPYPSDLTHKERKLLDNLLSEYNPLN